jgi:Domain of unknown function (DUF397)
MNGTDLSNAMWQKSSHSNHEANCVEVANLEGGQRAVRDSKNPAGPALIFPSTEWSALLAGIRAGEFD